MAFSGSTEYVGAIGSNDTGHQHLMNSFYIQRDTFANRPATANQGVTFIATDGVGSTGAGSEALYHDSGTTWALVGVIPAAENTYARIATGSYTGDGEVANAIGNLGFAPSFVWITLQVAANNTTHASRTFIMSSDVIVDDSTAGRGMAFDIGSNQTHHDAITSFDSSGFTVDDDGTDLHPNEGGIVYNFVAIG